MDWNNIPEPQTSWLVDGLFPSDGFAAICGKPKTGKSTVVRNLVASVIKGYKFLNRSIDIPTGTGRVLYVHLDRKDQTWRVAKELRQLGITPDESARLVLKTAQDVPSDSYSDRLAWLKKEIITANPHLIIIDLMWQFVMAKNANEYNEVLKGINALQDALTEARYGGALVVTLHGRKATNPNDPADDVLGSTGQRGSFSTLVMLTRHRKEGIYTIMSDQTERDDVYGEIDEAVIIRNPDGTLDLGRGLSELVKQGKQAKVEESLQQLLLYIVNQPGSEMAEIVAGLTMSKRDIVKLMKMGGGLIETKGKGIKGDPYKYFASGMGHAGAEIGREIGEEQIGAAQREMARFVASGGIGRPI